MKKGALYLLAAACVAALLIGLWSAWARRASSVLSAMLAHARVSETVSFKGIEYLVVDGELHASSTPAPSVRLKVFGLAYEKALARRSPLFSLAGTDPDELGRSVDKLEATKEGLATMQPDERSSTLVDQDLFPIEFLRSAAQLERDRLAFLATGNAADGKTYEKRFFETVRLYQKELDAYERGFREIVPEDERKYAAGNVLITREGILHALSTLRRSVESTAARQYARSRCSAGDTRACNASDLEAPTVEIPPARDVSAASRELSLDIRRIVADVRRTSTLFKNDPSILLSTSVCTGDIPGDPIFFVNSPTAQVPDPSFRPLYVGNIRFVQASEYRKVGFFGTLDDLGVDYINTPPLLHYTCSGYGRDFSMVHWVREVRTMALKERVSSFATDDVKKELEDIERSFTEIGALTRESDAARYVKLLVEDVPNVPPPLKARAESFALARKNNTAAYEQVVKSIADIEAANVRVKKKGLPADLDAPYLFFFRSSPVPLFMGDNVSATGTHEPLFESNRLNPEDEPYVYYSDLVKIPGQRAKVIRDMTAYRDMHVTSEDTPLQDSVEF